jgi:hypothetical protein
MKSLCCFVKPLCGALLLVCACPLAAYGQGRSAPVTTMGDPGPKDQPNRSSQERIDNLNRARERARNSQPRDGGMVHRTEYRMSAADKKFLAPSLEDRNAYANFLRQPDTGILRLVPLAEGRVVNINDLDKKKPPVLYNGAASCYSFSKARYNCDHWAEISLKDGMFRSGFADESLGLLVNLGDVPVESVTLQNAGLRQLAALAAPGDYDSAVNQHKQNIAGFKISSYAFRASMPAEINSTYALRSISYRRADVLVLFRAVRQDADGVVTLVWKRLRTGAPPELKGEPKE